MSFESGQTLRLSDDQKKVVETFGEGLAVMAGAGSGKTTTLVQKCLELIRRQPQSRFAAVSFTERSASDLRVKLTESLGSSPDRLGHWVMTIHGLCGSIIRDFPRESGFDGDEMMLSAGEAQVLWERALDGLWFEEIPLTIQEALESLLKRESRQGVVGLLSRVKDLQLFGVIKSLQESPDSDARALALLGSYSLERYDRLKRRRGALDFNDLEKGADLALGHPHVKNYYRKRFDLFLVDEFQDTNPVQARIVMQVVREGATNLCVVGDPKQSIYRFRDADVTVFEDFCKQMPVRISLSENYRSRPSIIEYTNEICAPLFESSHMEYIALEPKREKSDSPGVVRLNVQDPKELADWIRSEVSNGQKLESMALLLRKIRGNEKWIQSLSQAGIPVAVGSGGLFWEDARVRELIAFLKWWAKPEQSLSGAIFLRAPWVGIEDSTLDEWFLADPTGVKPFFESTHLLAKTLEPFRKQILRPGELLLKLLASQALEMELGAPLLGLWHRAEEYSSRGLSFSEVVRELSSACEDRRRERDVPPPENEGQLLILTLHGAKGLEFDRVILVDLPEKPPKAREFPLLYWDRLKGAFLGPRDEEGERDSDHELEKIWRTDEREKTLAESKRIFYVALTRAKEQLILVTPHSAILPVESKKKTETDIKLKDDWKSWALMSSRPHVLSIGEFNKNELNFNSSKLGLEFKSRDPETRFSIPARKVRHSVTEWVNLDTCPRKYEWKSIRLKTVPEEYFEWSEGADSDSVRMTQREIGSEIHLVLETGDWERLERLECEIGKDRIQASLIQKWASQSPLMNSGHEVWKELAFEVQVGPEFLVGAIDRLTREKKENENLYRIIDFKVTKSKKTASELSLTYRSQLESYALAVRTLIQEPQAKIETWIVNLYPEGVNEFLIALDSPEKIEEKILNLAEKAAAIVSGENAVPQPGVHCKKCDLKSICDAATPE